MKQNTCILVLVTFWTEFIHADEGGAYLHPVDPVRKVGDVVQFECRSPQDYTGFYFESVEFSLKHGDHISKPVQADSTRDNYSVKMFAKTITSQKDAGVYTCTITPSVHEKTVSVKTTLYVVEVEDKTAVAEVGKRANLSCLKSGHEDLPLIEFWLVAGQHVVGKSNKYSKDMPPMLQSTVREDAYKNITCLVASETAMDFYKSISVAAEHGAVMERNIDLSVVEINMDLCSNPTTCVLEARVFGNAAVNISWGIAGDSLHPVPNISANMTISKTPVLNITKTTPLEVYINDFGFDLGIKDPSTSSAPAWTMVGGVLGCVTFFSIYGI